LLQVLLSLLVRFLVGPYLHLANNVRFIYRPQLELQDLKMVVSLHLVHLLPNVVEQMRRVYSLHENRHHVKEEREHRQHHNGLEIERKNVLYKAKVEAQEMLPDLTKSFHELGAEQNLN